MKEVRPSWVPERMDWYAGEPKDSAGYHIREAHSTDYESLRRVCRAAGRKPNARTFSRWLGQNNFTVNVAVRNRRHVIAACVSDHQPEQSTILVCHVYDQWSHWPLMNQLLLLAALELPERPLIWTFGGTIDDARGDRLRRFGWTFDGKESSDGEEERLTYRLAPFVAGRHAEIRERDRPKPPPSAGDDDG